MLLFIIYNDTKANYLIKNFQQIEDSIIPVNDSSKERKNNKVQVIYKNITDSLKPKTIDFTKIISIQVTYKIQIISSTDKKKAERFKEELIRKYPNEKILLTKKDSLYNVQVSNFQTREEAEKMEKQLKKDNYPTWLNEEKSVTEHAAILPVNGKLNLLIQEHIAYNKKHPTIKGYKVQVASSSDRKKVLEIRAKFHAQYPDHEIYYKWKPPYHKLRVGCFRTIWEAKKLRQELLKNFGTAYIVPDDIDIKDLK